jgi:hypothetical protein
MSTAPTLNASPADRARKMEALFLQRLTEPGTAKTLSLSLGSNETTISRLKNDHAPMLFGMLAHLGLKLVPVELCCTNPDIVRGLEAQIAEYRRQAGDASVADLMGRD